MKKAFRFELYRYQILPIDRYFQGELFSGIKSVEDLLEKKNRIFAEKLEKIKTIEHRNAYIISKLLFSDKDFYLFRFAVNRSVIIETKEFKEEEISNWPSFLIGIWNKSEKQLIAIQERKEAFSNTESGLRALEKSINLMLVSNQLRTYIEPLFKEEEFWKIIDQYENRVKEISFELITPNMANISGVLSEDLKNFAKNTNSAKSKLSITSDPESSLNVAHIDHQMKGLVEYSSKGGGNISIKVSGLKKRIQTTKTKMSVELGDFEISANTAQEIAEILKGVLD